MAIQITSREHWDALSRRGLNVVVDPMVVRCGELLLQGARGVDDPKAVWELLTKNIHAIGMFFDSIILEKKLPIFNYGASLAESPTEASGSITVRWSAPRTSSSRSIVARKRQKP